MPLNIKQYQAGSIKMKTLKENYKRNVEIMRENLRRGMSVGQATSVINAMRNQFVRANLYGEDEKEFINAMLAEVEAYTHIKVVEV